MRKSSAMIISISTIFLIQILSNGKVHVQGQGFPHYPHPPHHPVERLDNYRVNREYITLSGFSSGGSLAQQVFISHSKIIYGIAVFAHTYYRCGPITTRQSDYDAACTTLGNHSTWHDFSQAFRDINEYADQHLIDSPRNLHNKPLYVYIASRNWLFNTEQSYRIVELFEPYIGNRESIRAVIQEGNLTLPVNRLDFPPCVAPTNRYFLSNCGFSGPFDSLQFLLGKKAIVAPTPPIHVEPLLTFDQTEFFYGFDDENDRPDMDSVGFLYIPKACKENVECFLHFYFHGCSAGREFVGSEHIRLSGFLEIAEENGIIMVFPQAASSEENDIGCWDTYGFTGDLYATKKGSQVTVIRNMIARILKEDTKKHTPNRFPHSSTSSQTLPSFLPQSAPPPPPPPISQHQEIQFFPPRPSSSNSAIRFPPEDSPPRLPSGPLFGEEDDDEDHDHPHGPLRGGIKVSKISSEVNHHPHSIRLSHPNTLQSQLTSHSQNPFNQRANSFQSTSNFVGDFFNGNADIFRYLDNFPNLN